MARSQCAPWARNPMHVWRWQSWEKLDFDQLLRVRRDTLQRFNEIDRTVVYGREGKVEFREQARISLYLADLERIDNLLMPRLARALAQDAELVLKRAYNAPIGDRIKPPPGVLSLSSENPQPAVAAV